MKKLPFIAIILLFYNTSFALTDYYVDLSVAGTGYSGTENDPLSWEQLGDLMEVNNTDQAGKRFNIRGNITLTATDTWLADGTATSPIVLRGCSGTGTTWTPITPTRSNGGTGPLVVTNYPVITYNGNYQLNASGSNGLYLNAISLASAYWGPTISGGSYGLFNGCKFVNSGNNGSATAAWVMSDAVMCDVSCTGASSGTALALLYGGNAVGCMVMQTASNGIGTSQPNTIISDCVIYGHSGYGIYFGSGTLGSGHRLRVLHTTIYGGNGIGFADNAYPDPSLIMCNHITDGSGYAVKGPATASAAIILSHNRTRDNTSGAVSWNGDWDDATTFGHVVTDTGGPNTDYVNAAGGDFRLVSDAAGVGQGIMGSDIGAIQRADPTLPDASTVLSEAYGGSTWGDSFALRRGTATLASAANVWFNTGSFGKLWATVTTVRGTMGNDGENLIFTSYSPLPAGVEVGHEIMIAGKWAEISAISVARTESTIINPEAGFPESGTLLVATISSPGLSPIVPSKRASSIPKCEPEYIKSGITIDDVLGTYGGYPRRPR